MIKKLFIFLVLLIFSVTPAISDDFISISLLEGTWAEPSISIDVESELPGATFGITTGHAVFNEIKDPVLSVGYNIGALGSPLIQGEPVLWFNIEGDYYNGITRSMEFNLNYLSGDTLVFKRPLYFEFDRDTHYVSSRLGGDDLRLLAPIIYMTITKSGATQAEAGANVNELWKTSGHAILPDGVLMIGQ